MIQDVLLKLIVLLLPTQLGLHFWPGFSRVSGLKIDYLSPTLYFLDILIIFYLLKNAKLLLDKLKKLKTFPFVLLISLNLLFSQNQANTAFQYLRLLEYFLLYLVLVDVPNLWKKIGSTFFLSLCFVFALQTAQFFKQSSLNGIFYYLGERYFTASTPNIPRIVIINKELLRVFSTFSHANSLAGFMLLSALILKIKKSDKKVLLPLFSIIISFSKSALFGVLFIFSQKKHFKVILVGSVLFSFGILFPNLPKTGNLSLDSRTEMIKNYRQIPPKLFISGVGLGNYPVLVSSLLPGSMQTISSLQPIHNIFLLLLIELGAPLFIFLIYVLFKNTSPKYYPIFSIVIVTGLFDHYWVTLPQNKLILILALALA